METETRLRQVEREMVGLAEKLNNQATREWVRDLVRPIEAAVTDINRAVQELTGETKALFDAHNAFLKEKADAERKELEARTAGGMVKRYAPVAAFILSLFTLFRVAGTYIEVWMQNVGGK